MIGGELSRCNLLTSAGPKGCDRSCRCYCCGNMGLYRDSIVAAHTDPVHKACKLALRVALQTEVER
jgi:hypothetical protein